MRLYGALLLLLALGLLSGCPQPINYGGEKAQVDSQDDLSASAEESANEQAEPQLDAGADEQHGTEAESPSTAAEDEAEEEAESAGVAGDKEETAEEPPKITDGEVTFPGRKRGPAEEDEPAEAAAGEEQDLLDPAAMLGDAVDEPVKTSKRPAPLDAAARAFSGDWAVIAVNQGGHSRMAEADDEWLFKLGNDGSCSVSRSLEGKTSEQSGRWELNDDELMLRLGPARRAYSIEQPREDVALFTDQQAGAVLFCVRLTPSERAPQLQASYELGGSELRFRSAGPGGYWRGTLTEPECSLLVRPVSKFVAGTWETPQDDGYVLLELNKDGFDGWWWYSDSTEFDGVWRSGAE